MASDGLRSVDLSGGLPGTLSQMLNTVAGQLYSVSFDISKNPDSGPIPRLGSSSVSDGSGASIASLALSFSTPNSRDSMMWQSVSYFFTAVSQQTLLTFAADPGSQVDAGLTLDNVSVVAVDSIAAVPEPATWALMILGFGIVGSALRRRRTQVRFNFA